VNDAWPRLIAHADMDAFYASIEQLDAPALRGRPVLVGPDSERGVVLTASYEARPFGVGSAMPMAWARRRCPQALIVPPRFDRYQAVSADIMRVFEDFSPRVEALSLDEAFLDLSGSGRVLGDPASIGRRLKEAVREATGGLSVSVGMSATKYVAKVASGYRKPDGLTIVPPERAEAWLAPLPVAALWGVGTKTEKRLKALGLETIGAVARAEPARLVAALGEAGRRFFELAHARDPRPVISGRAAKSIGSERTFSEDISDAAELALQLRRAAEIVGRRLRRKRYRAGGVRVKLKTADFRVLTRQRSLPRPTDSTACLAEEACALLAELVGQGPFRLVGLSAYGLEEPDRQEDTQMTLLNTNEARNRRLERTLDELAERFGQGVVQRAARPRGAREIGSGANLDSIGGPGKGGGRGSSD
jgi:DNA polymerase-4